MNRSGRALAAISSASSAMLSSRHPVDILADLIQDSLEVLGAKAAGILVTDSTSGLRLVTASSHRAEEIELLQALVSDGPCIDAIRGGKALTASGEEIARKWPASGGAILGFGFVNVDAFPMKWQGKTVGGLNVFREATSRPDDADRLGRAMADVATLVLLRSVDIAPEQVALRIDEAVRARSRIEQAKGVLAWLNDIPIEDGYRALRDLADAEGAGLLETADSVINEQFDR